VKVRDRRSYEFALASATVALDLRGGTVRDARVAVGGVGTVPWRLPALEAARPVKTMLTREQAFTVVGHRPASSQTVSLGAARDDSASPVAANAGGSGSTSTNGVVDAGRYRRVRIVGTAGAVANAVYDATGRRVRDLPITLDKLLP
jgi:CO/xanthine dehydrogenase Mo-binding subunit